jgi:hypothetical protein
VRGAAACARVAAGLRHGGAARVLLAATELGEGPAGTGEEEVLAVLLPCLLFAEEEVTAADVVMK